MGRKSLLKQNYTEDGNTGSAPSAAFEDIVSSLNKQLGNVAYVLGDEDIPSEVKEFISTGSVILDTIISNNREHGGVPVGRLSTCAGESATGKSLLGYMILKNCKDRGGIPVLIDTENTADFSFLKMIGLDPEKREMIYIQVDSTEDVFIAMEAIIKKIRTDYKDKLCCIVWDSVAATSTRKELENEYGESTMGLQARLIGQGLRKIIRYIGRERIALVFLNQLRCKIGAPAFVDPFTESGGLAIPFHASVRLRLYSAGKIKIGTDTIGASIKVRVQKNKLGPPFRECLLNMYYNRGIIEEETWLDMLRELQVVKEISKQKSSIDFNGQIIEFKNKEFSDFIRKEENKEINEFLRTRIKDVLFVEQDPSKRDEDVLVEELTSTEAVDV